MVHDRRRGATGAGPAKEDLSARAFASRLSVYYAALCLVFGVHMPFFPVWLDAKGLDARAIGLVNALPAITRFTTLPQVTAFAEKRHAIRAAMMVSVLATAIGFTAVGLQSQPLALFLIYALTCMMWTPTMPLTDAYALRGVARYGLDYGPLRLWGSAAFAAGSLACGYLVDVIAARDLIWVIVAWAVVAVLTSALLQPLDDVRHRTTERRAHTALLRDAGFWAIIASAALIQGSHVAYYTFSAINWQLHGYSGVVIGGLWTLGVIAEIVVFLRLPGLFRRFSLSAILLASLALAVIRFLGIGWLPASLWLLVPIQLMHAATFGAFHAASVAAVHRVFPESAQARGQTFFSSLSYGAGGAAGALMAGWTWPWGAGMAFSASAAAAAVGACFAWRLRRFGL